MATKVKASRNGRAKHILKPSRGMPDHEHNGSNVRTEMRLKPIARMSGVGVNGTINLVQPTNGLSHPAETVGERSFDVETVPATVSAKLQQLQRERAFIIKSRIMMSNRLRAKVAGTIGYHSGMKESERQQKWKEAAEIIKKISKGDNLGLGVEEIVRTMLVGINAFDDIQTPIDKTMVKLVESLPIIEWLNHKDQKGFGIQSCAVVIGETGDLSNYANPAKIWRRMGCAPFTFDDKTLMGSTWRYGKEGKLPADQWEEYGYSPRRRAIIYVVGETLLKLNAPGPYRHRYDEAKSKMKADHPDYSDKRCHLHGMLCMTKRLLRNLWIEWNK